MKLEKKVIFGYKTKEDFEKNWEIFNGTAKWALRKKNGVVGDKPIKMTWRFEEAPDEELKYQVIYEGEL